MNQQDFFSRGGYPNNLNPSPTSGRQGYNTTVGVPAASRLTQRQVLGVDQLAGPSPFLEDRYSTYTDLRHARIQSPPNYADTALPGSFMGVNSQAWQHNSGANTINGAMVDGPRSRGGARPPLPADWVTLSESPQVNHGLYGAQSTQYAIPNHFTGPMGMMNGGASLSGDRHGFQTLESLARQTTPKSLSPDLIPTAIVIKNIPFNVRKETLAQYMHELGLPTPYAFNYHFDNGIFRGLAFANFQNPEDTYQVIERLNGFEVSGRKLRVEYKKMLPEAERERIEREKREKRGQLEEQHQPIKAHAQPAALHMPHVHSAPNSRGGGDALRDLDMNDQETLNYFTELTLFRNDPAREIIIFPPTMTSSQRRIVHTLAHHMGLNHRSVGEGVQRQLHVLKPETAISSTTGASIHAPTVHQNRGLNRAATIDFAETRSALNHYSSTLSRTSRPTLELPETPDVNNLRGVKSFADLRDPRSTPSPAPSMSAFGTLNGGHSSNVALYGEYSSGGAFQAQSSNMTTPTTPGGTAISEPNMLLAGLNGMNLTDSFPTSQARSNPGAIGSQRPGLNGPTSRAQPDRQPVGPGNGDRSEFGGWRRQQNGHSQRDSDSSDNGTRGSGAPGSARFN